MVESQEESSALPSTSRRFGLVTTTLKLPQKLKTLQKLTFSLFKNLKLLKKLSKKHNVKHLKLKSLVKKVA